MSAHRVCAWWCRIACRAVQRIHLGQQADVFCRIAPRKRHDRRPAPVLDVPAVGELRNAAGDLRTGETAHLAQVLPQQALVGALAGRVAKLPERVGHPAVGDVAIRQRK